MSGVDKSTTRKTSERKLARMGAESPDVAQVGDGELDAPWTTESLRLQQGQLRAIDVCGAMDECRAGRCPCWLLGDVSDD